MLKKIQTVAAQVSQIILGKDAQIRLSLTCLIAGGHLLLEDVPGVGKTTLAHALAISLGLEFRRVQFTNDLLPADLSGVSIFNRETSTFNFHPGPLFSNLLLADEINRATPKTQSALLEAMEEKQVSTDGITRELPTPFFVLATQNPSEQMGTFPLPESQLDRFLMRISLGYPDPKAERELLQGQDKRQALQALHGQINLTDLITIQQQVKQIHVSNHLIDYVQAILQHTRQSGNFIDGLSPRAGLALLQASRAWALLDGRNHVIPEDVQAVFPSVANHRLIPAQQHHHSYQGVDLTFSQNILETVAIP
jgi:MoxR-like ATPase